MNLHSLQLSPWYHQLITAMAERYVMGKDGDSEERDLARWPNHCSDD